MSGRNTLNLIKRNSNHLETTNYSSSKTTERESHGSQSFIKENLELSAKVC
jgi:hypothetical protein